MLPCNPLVDDSHLQMKSLARQSWDSVPREVWTLTDIVFEAGEARDWNRRRTTPAQWFTSKLLQTNNPLGLFWLFGPGSYFGRKKDRKECTFLNYSANYWQKDRLDKLVSSKVFGSVEQIWAVCSGSKARHFGLSARESARHDKLPDEGRWMEVQISGISWGQKLGALTWLEGTYLFEGSKPSSVDEPWWTLCWSTQIN